MRTPAPNGVDASYTDSHGLSQSATTFDVVLANILSNPLKLLAPALARARRSRTVRWCCPGILERQADEVIATYRRADASLALNVLAQRGRLGLPGGNTRWSAPAMALATKCPQCGALFRVVADQLKLRGGLVRCGQCRAVFDAIGSLTYVDDSALAQTRTITALTQPAAAGPAASARASPAHAQHRTRPPYASRAAHAPGTDQHRSEQASAGSGNDAPHRADCTRHARQCVIAPLGALAGSHLLIQ